LGEETIDLLRHFKYTSGGFHHCLDRQSASEAGPPRGRSVHMLSVKLTQ
jgi:hypothetical protein